ncbi:hypothetical protein [Kitasatospora sp. NPDC085464]|uniref:hypothetical protein n=1 Tax=Kitasatospora sp. NPDC085464 TaxID=3364063 RepID=UPI0037CC172B
MAKQLTGGRVLLWSLLGRLPTAMSPIGTLLLVSRNTGSVWSGSLVAGALAGGQAIGGPVVGRLADRRGRLGHLRTLRHDGEARQPHLRRVLGSPSTADR